MIDVRRRGPAVLAAAVLVLAACTGPGGAGPDPTEAGGPGGSGATLHAESPVTLEPVEQDPREDVPSALQNMRDPDLPPAAVDVGRIIPGGPPPDGIPPIDAPLFEPASGVAWLAENEPVVALSLQGEERAYPIQILMWHEIVNDTVGGRPVTVTYCPLCNTALAFDRQVGDRLLTFGTSGRLYLSALVMYDRQTESLWSQVERRAIAGVLTGTELELVPVSMIRWQDWLEANPDGWVLSRRTGFVRDYGRNPYVGYDAHGGTLLDEPVDGRLPAKERVVTFPDAETQVAVLLTELAAVRVAEVLVDEQAVVLFSDPGLASSLDSSVIADGRQISATGAFLPRAADQRLTFRASNGGTVVAVDEQTGTQWDLLGRAVAGPLAGERLDPVPHIDTFWFAQAAFAPDTTVIDIVG